MFSVSADKNIAQNYNTWHNHLPTANSQYYLQDTFVHFTVQQPHSLLDLIENFVVCLETEVVKFSTDTDGM